MALKDDFEARYPLHLRAQWSNPGTKQPTTQNDTLVAAAVTDAEADFEGWIQAAFDSTNARHVSFAVQLVVFKLKSYKAASAESVRKEREDLEAEAKRLKNTTSRARVIPSTDGEMDPSRDGDGSATSPKPWSDRENYAGLAPRRSHQED